MTAKSKASQRASAYLNAARGPAQAAPVAATGPIERAVASMSRPGLAVTIATPAERADAMNAAGPMPGPASAILSVVSATATYHTLRSGAWGVRVIGTPWVSPGDRIEVTKRDGSRTVETINRVFWSEDQTHICSIVGAVKVAPRKRGRGGWRPAAPPVAAPPAAAPPARQPVARPPLPADRSCDYGDGADLVAEILAGAGGAP
jgi:hypothetical protein